MWQVNWNTNCFSKKYNSQLSTLVAKTSTGYLGKDNSKNIIWKDILQSENLQHRSSDKPNKKLLSKQIFFIDFI